MLGFLASQRVGIEHVIVTAANQTRVSVYAGYEPVTVSRNGESGIRPELSGLAVIWYFGWTLEAHNS